MEKNKIIKKLEKTLFILLASAMLWGCGSRTEVAFADTLSVNEVKDSLEIYERPEVVAELPKEDKTLCNGIYSLSTEAFPVVQVLSENNYFKYDLLAEEDFDQLNTITEKTNVSVIMYRDSNYTDWCCRFSCFIYKIDPDYVYLGTAGHCIINNSNNTRAKITFYDRSSIYVSLAEFKKGAGFGSEKGDYAMYRFPTSALPDGILYNLKEVNYDKSALEEVKTGDTLFTGNIYAMKPEQDYDKTMKVFDKADMAVKNGLSSYNAYNNSNYFLTDTSLVPGQSGSGIFDQYGNLVAICSGGSYNHKVGIYTAATKIDELYDAFNEISTE